MEFGLFTEFQCPAGMREAVAFDESMAQMRAAEDLGFDAVWLAEIHFQKDRSVLASPLVAFLICVTRCAVAAVLLFAVASPSPLKVWSANALVPASIQT